MTTKSQNRLRFLNPKPIQPNHPLFIFLPGMDGTGELLYTQADGLANSFDIRCLTIPSHDFSDWDTLASQVINLIEAELGRSSERPVYICGESFGGCLALKVAQEAPDLLDRLILINPASSFNQRPLLSWGISLTQWIPEFLHQTSTIGLLPFLGTLGKIESGGRRALLEAMKLVPQPTVSWRLSLLKEFTIKKHHLRRLKQPVLLIAGAGDRLLPSVEEAKRLANNLPNAQIVILPGSGHACLLETDVQLHEILQDYNFLAENVLEVLGN